MTFARPDGRSATALRPITVNVGVSKFAEGSAEISFGDTKVLCLATLQESVPKFLDGKGTGWITAEYAMLPRSTPERSQRESIAGRPGGRTFEIQRLVGRALRAAIDLKALGPRSVMVDCEVIQADGGTRTAAITGAFVALGDAIGSLVKAGTLTGSPIRDCVAAISVGMVGNRPVLDLNYVEDSTAEVDMNVVMTGAGAFVEVQGTAEQTPFSKARLDELLVLAGDGIARLVGLQRRALEARGDKRFTL